VLFVDELNSAVPDVQKAFYSLILDRRLGDYVLPKARASSPPAIASRTARSCDRWRARWPTAWCTSARAVGRRVARVGGAGVGAPARDGVRARAPGAHLGITAGDATRHTRPRAPGTCSPTRSPACPTCCGRRRPRQRRRSRGAEFAAFARRAREVPAIDDVASARPPSRAIRSSPTSSAPRASARSIATRPAPARRSHVAWSRSPPCRRRSRCGRSTPRSPRLRRGPAFAQFEETLRTEGQATLADVLRLGRYTRE